jgi:hypothetical protein
MGFKVLKMLYKLNNSKILETSGIFECKRKWCSFMSKYCSYGRNVSLKSESMIGPVTEQ